ncbi:uncharacterized protein LOC125678342 [Ostrea edulis]|uniref:uncharacterized protein LOC125678342 n=1 Tax=Ostrea edulis TaxID=37623 RepID=UPI0024AF989D|nr:uncharacterized protein LOC125678342 [Ostrea edulis]
MSRAKVHDDGNVITQQPSANPGPNENASVFPKTTELGTELEAIEELEKIVLSQVISACDLVFPCCIGRGSYTVHDGNGSPEALFEIREAFVCLFRTCLGSARDFASVMRDSSGDDLGSFRYAMSFRGCCICSCYPPELFIFCPRPVRLGSVRERLSCCRPSFEIVDNKGDTLFTFSNDCCYSQYCGWFMDAAVKVNDMEGQTVAKLVKKSFHNPEELLGLENKIHIEFLKKMRAPEKLLVIGAALLLSLKNFENTQRLCC